ncbi:MAG TPA: efflux RND transporter permease subunit [Planctomycetota bacterium]|nr:efflux RND transporter permease subunit [Planctomycetota bacterium]
MIISDTAIRNRISVGVLVVLIAIAGIYSYRTLPLESAPDVPIPVILVTTVYEGVSPVDVESTVTSKIEKELAGLKGLKELRSTSLEGMSLVVVEFMPDVIIEDALQYVRDRVDKAKPDLPLDAEEPSVREINVADFPIMMVAVSGDISPVQMKLIADDLEDRIEQLPGVLNVDVMGTLEREIRLEFDRDRIAMYSLTIPELLALIPSENVNISAGGLETAGTKFNVRVPGEFDDPAEADRLLLAVRNGKPIYLSDVATVRDAFKDSTSYSRLNGLPSVTVSVQKRVGANIVDTANQVKAALEAARKQVPEGVHFNLIYDESKYINMMVVDLENNIVTGLILVVAVLMLFVGLRASMIVALAIPLSMLMSFTVILMLGYTLNMIVLFSLVLSLGMLVDNAIVIVENICRHRQLGSSKLDAAINATTEVAWPVITSTLTTVAAFFPLMFWPGIMGDFMKYLPITLIITLSSSLFVALVINPTVCSIAGGAAKEKQRNHWFMRGYHRFLNMALVHRFVTLSLAILLLAGVTLLYLKRGGGVEFFPDIDPDQAVVNIRCPQGTNLNETDRLARLVEGRLKGHREQIDHVAANVGSAGAGAQIIFGGGTGGPHVANLTLIFRDYLLREHPSVADIVAIRTALTDIPGAEIKVEKQQHGPPTGQVVTVRIIGEDFAVLGKLNEQVKQMIADVPGLVNLRSDLEATRPELAFRIDRRRAALLGVNTSVVGRFLKMAIFGNKVGTYRQFDDEYDITLRLPYSERVNIESILTLQVPNAWGKAVPLSSLGSFDYQGGYGTINRVNQKRVVTVSGDAEGRLSTEVLQDVQTRLATLNLQPGYEIKYAGEKEEQEKAVEFLSKAFVIAVLLVTLVLVGQFNSLAVPGIIMFTVGLSLVGVLAGLLICGRPFGIIMTGVGVISLAGVVVNNAIVLLDYTRQLQRRGRDLLAAAREAGETRLRPVLLTASTTTMGLVPMAIGVSYDFHTFEWSWRSQSSEWWSGMALAVIFGLAFATVLTLVVVPTLYVTVYRLFPRFSVKAETEPDDRQRSAPEPTT